METAQITLSQITRRTRMEMGLREFLRDGNSLTMRCGWGHASARVWVTLDPSDTYTVRFLKVRNTVVTTLAEVSDVYCDVLNDVLVSMWCDICSERGW